MIYRQRFTEAKAQFDCKTVRPRHNVAYKHKKHKEADNWLTQLNFGVKESIIKACGRFNVDIYDEEDQPGRIDALTEDS